VSARDLEELAAKLGRPPTALSAFRGLTPDQVGLLSDLIDRARQRYRVDREAALGRAIPAVPRRVLLALLRGRSG
jgi:hypothetical protein